MRPWKFALVLGPPHDDVVLSGSNPGNVQWVTTVATSWWYDVLVTKSRKSAIDQQLHHDGMIV